VKLKIAVYPNNELRATFYHERRTKDESTDSENGLGDSDDDAGHRDSIPLDITSKLYSPSERPGFGGMPKPTKFGNAARRTLSRAAGVFERDNIPRGECLFLTGTIPGSSMDSFDAVAHWSSWIVQQIKIWINNQGVIGNYSMYVWEFQKRGALHIHYFVHVPDELARQKIMWKWAIKWAALITEVGKKFGCDTWEKRDGSSWSEFPGIIQAPAQFVKKSVGAYLSKYLSKNAPSPHQRNDGNDMFLGPVRWWGVSRPLLKRLNELTETFEVEGLTEDGRRTISAQVAEEFRCSGNEVHSYWDKGFNALTILTYSPKWCQNIYNRLWRDLYGPKLAQLTRFRRLANGPGEEAAIRAIGTTSTGVCYEENLGQLQRYLSESLGLCIGVRASRTASGTNIAEVKGSEKRTAVHAGARLTTAEGHIQLQLVAI
jgi:hypothetical protein